MIHLRIKITWPAALLILLAVLIWLTRDPAKASRKAPPTPRRTEERPFVINQQPDDDDHQAEDLDRDAAERGQRAYHRTTSAFDDLRERLEQRNAKRNARTATR